MPTPPVPPLTIHTLGYFAIWRGEERLEEKAWGREKARQLFQYLVTNRPRLLPRERMVDDLWPELPPEKADRDFKVALNALNDALQPSRPPRSLSTYITRQSTSYGLNPEAPLLIDVDVFEQQLALGSQWEKESRPRAIHHYRLALEKYLGEYLPDTLYFDWASLERERLATLYLTGATRLARLLLAEGSIVESLLWSQRVIAIDPFWEEAYRLIMRGHWQSGNRPLALRTYEQCRTRLEEELAITPMNETTRLWQQMVKGEI